MRELVWETRFKQFLTILRNLSILFFLLAVGIGVYKFYYFKRGSQPIEEKILTDVNEVDIKLLEAKAIRFRLPKGIIVRVLIYQNGIDLKVGGSIDIFLSGKWNMAEKGKILVLTNPPKEIKGEKIKPNVSL
jgi:hypothetical protein